MSYHDELKTSSREALRSLIHSIVPRSKESRLDWAAYLHKVADELYDLGIETPTERNLKTP